jgi:hypothetical protein
MVNAPAQIEVPTNVDKKNVNIACVQEHACAGVSHVDKLYRRLAKYLAQKR